MRRNQDFMPMQRGRQTDLAPQSGSQTGPNMLLNISPWQMMRRIQEDMDRVFGQFLGGGAGEGTAQGGQQSNLLQWTPRMDVSETEREWLVEVDLPGADEGDIEIAVQDNLLIIRAELLEEKEAPEGGQSGNGQAQGGQAQRGQTSGGQSTGSQATGGQATGGQATGGQATGTQMQTGRTQGRQGTERQYYYRERRYGYFERVLRLPENVDEDQIRAEFRNGVLMVHIPKMEQARQQGRRVEIGTGEQRERGAGNGRSQQQREPAMAGTRGGEAGSAGAGEQRPSTTGGAQQSTAATGGAQQNTERGPSNR